MEIVLGIKVPSTERHRIFMATHVPMPLRLSWDASLPNAGQWNDVLGYQAQRWGYAWTVTDAPTVEVFRERLGRYMEADKMTEVVAGWVNEMAHDLGARNNVNKRSLWDKWHPGEAYRKSWEYCRWGWPRPDDEESLIKILRCAALYSCYKIIQGSQQLHTVSHGVNEARDAVRLAFKEYTLYPEATEDALLAALELLRQRTRIAFLVFSTHHRPPAGTFKRLYDMMDNYYDAVMAPRAWKDNAKTRSIGLKFMGEDRVAGVLVDDEVRDVLLPRCVLRFAETRTMYGWNRYRFERTFTVHRAEMDGSGVISPGAIATILADGSAIITRGGTVVEPFLHLVQMDPEGIIREVGKAMGHCAFCGNQITTDISRDRGVGPECFRLAEELLGDKYKYDIRAQLCAVPSTGENSNAIEETVVADQTGIQTQTQPLRIKALDGEVVIVKDIVRRHSAFLSGFGDDMGDNDDIEMPMDMTGDQLLAGLGLMADLLFYVENASTAAPCLAWPKGTFWEAESLIEECLRVFCPDLDAMNACIKIYEWLMVTFPSPGSRKTNDASVFAVMIKHLIRASLA